MKSRGHNFDQSDSSEIARPELSSCETAPREVGNLTGALQAVSETEPLPSEHCGGKYSDDDDVSVVLTRGLARQVLDDLEACEHTDNAAAAVFERWGFASAISAMRALSPHLA